MVSNACDENISKVEVTLTPPDVNGISVLTVTDDSPTGWKDLTHSYTMFAESTKKDKSEKRGRFNAGEKDVLALAVDARLTTMSGSILFNSDGTRTTGTGKTKCGSVFTARFNLTQDEWQGICDKAGLLLPPENITTVFNGRVIGYRSPMATFDARLPIPLADKEGVIRNVERKAKVAIYEPAKGEKAMIFEMGIPIVELGDDKWHVNIMQKVPLSRDRDNVNPSYLSKVRVAVLNENFGKLSSKDAAATWVHDAVGNKRSKDDAVKHVIYQRFETANVVSRSVGDKGSAREAQSKDYKVIEGGAMTGDEWKRVKAIIVTKSDGTQAPLVPSSGELALQRMAQKAEPTYQVLVKRIRAAPSVTADETGWKVVKGARGSVLRSLP
jgi:hypothetical protein